MKIKSITLENYKSLGLEKNRIIIENDITVIIGKNESGKTNILNGMNNVSFTSSMAEGFKEQLINRKNRSLPQNNSIIYKVELILTKEESDLYAVSDNSNIFFSQDEIEITGALCSIFQRHLEAPFNDLFVLANANPFSMTSNDLNTLRTFNNYLKSYTKTYPYKITNALNSFKSWLSRIRDVDQKVRFNETLDIATKEWSKLINLFPKIFFRNSDKILSTSYTYEQASKELENKNVAPKSLLFDFVKLINISKDDFLKAVQNPTSDISIDIVHRINTAINKYINDPFGKFYLQETIVLNAVFSNNLIKFSVRSSNGHSLPLNERSNGLRWYLNLFIDMQSNNLPDSNILFLLDEPGVALHVNAQKQLINLFNDLALKNNQVVYTTHSPFMLNVDKLHHIRAIDKNSDGITLVYPNVYNASLSKYSKEDILSPLLAAIGYDLKHDITPSAAKINVVTEGITDYIYIHSFMRYFKNKNNINIIPATGASNVKNICAILYGWGYNFKAVFDFDKEGVEKGAKPLAKGLDLVLGKDYFFVSDINDDDINNKKYISLEYKKEIENLISDEDYVTLESLYNGFKKLGKLLKAKTFYDLLESKSFEPSITTIDNFGELFSRMNL